MSEPDPIVQAAAWALADPSVEKPEWFTKAALGRDMTPLAEVAVAAARPHIGAETCTCPFTDPEYWTTHYGAIEPGGTQEYEPTCPLHGMLRAEVGRLTATLDKVRALVDGWEREWRENYEPTRGDAARWAAARRIRAALDEEADDA